MLSGPNNIRQLCNQIVEANKINDDAKVHRLTGELRLAIRSHIQQTRVMAAHAVRQSFLKSPGSYEEGKNGSTWSCAEQARHDKPPAKVDRNSF